MEKRPAIWSRLQEHSTPPPPEVTAELLRGLATDDESFRGGLGRLQELPVMPPDDLRVMVRSQIGVVEKEGRQATVFALVLRRAYRRSAAGDGISPRLPAAAAATLRLRHWQAVDGAAPGGWPLESLAPPGFGGLPLPAPPQ